MNTESAKKACKILEDIDQLEYSLGAFEKTKEFSKITFSGENGNEKPYSFSIGPSTYDMDLVKDMRLQAIAIIQKKIKTLKQELEDL